MVTLVAGMALHLDVHPAVEHLQAEVDLHPLGVTYYLPVTIDAVNYAHIVGNVLAKTGERDNTGVAILVAGVYGIPEFLDTHIVILRIVHSLIKVVAAVQSADKPVLPENGPVQWIYQFDAFAAKKPGCPAGLLDVPVLLVTPVHNRLVNSTLSGASFRRYIESST